MHNECCYENKKILIQIFCPSSSRKSNFEHLKGHNMGKICEGWGYGFEDYLKFTFVALKVYFI